MRLESNPVTPGEGQGDMAKTTHYDLKIVKNSEEEMKWFDALCDRCKEKVRMTGEDFTACACNPRGATDELGAMVDDMTEEEVDRFLGGIGDGTKS